MRGFGAGGGTRSLSLAVVGALVVLTAACGDEASSPATGPSPGGAGNAGVLTGTVGQPDDPDSFTIVLTDGSGRPVTSLPAGRYQVRVSDRSEIHNFRLTGPGVEESTGVPGTGEVTWEVTLEPGSYTFKCDPHPQRMVGNFTVI